MKYPIAVIAIIFAVLVGAAAGYAITTSDVVTTRLQSQADVNTVTVTTTQTIVVVSLNSVTETSIANGGSETSAVLSSNGLELVVYINATAIKVGQQLNVTVSIFNALNQTNIIPVSDDWSFTGVPIALWPACYFQLPAQMVILNGNYDLQDLPTVANVPFQYECMEDVSVDHAIFQPSSNQANVTGIYYGGSSSNQSLGPFQLSTNFTTGGYWNLLNLSKELNIPIIGEYPPKPPDSISFVPGEYTIAVEDECGQEVIMHLTVLSDLSSG